MVSEVIASQPVQFKHQISVTPTLSALNFEVGKALTLFITLPTDVVNSGRGVRWTAGDDTDLKLQQPLKADFCQHSFFYKEKLKQKIFPHFE